MPRFQNMTRPQDRSSFPQILVDDTGWFFIKMFLSLHVQPSGWKHKTFLIYAAPPTYPWPWGDDPEENLRIRLGQ